MWNYLVCRYQILGMQISNFRVCKYVVFKTPHIQIRFQGKDPIFKYEFLVLFSHPCLVWFGQAEPMCQAVCFSVVPWHILVSHVWLWENLSDLRASSHFRVILRLTHISRHRTWVLRQKTGKSLKMLHLKGLFFSLLWSAWLQVCKARFSFGLHCKSDEMSTMRGRDDHLDQTLGIHALAPESDKNLWTV